jgi:pyrroline-5-carboxylate reductase
MVAPIYTGTMVTLLPRISILGTGHMGGAILTGLIQPGVTTKGLVATTQSEASAVALRAKGVEVTSLEHSPRANSEAITKADIIVLSVKPHAILELLREVAPHAQPHAVVVSVAAGITLSSMEALWPGAVIRAMPNTPAQVGMGVTGMAVGRTVSAAQRTIVRSMFETVGSVIEVAEEDINALSALSGSGPAYVYFFIERFLEVAGSYGFSSADAKVMIHGTFSGAMALLEDSGATPADLRTAVTSPGGTTEAALKVFSDADMTRIIHSATEAAIARSRELSGD